MRKWGLVLVIVGVISFLAGGAISWAQGGPAGNDFVYNDHGHRDPFGKLISPNGVILTHENDLTAEDLSLEGILADDSGKNIAIINSRVVKEGETLGAFTVVKIAVNSVVLQKDQDIFTLRLKKEE